MITAGDASTIELLRDALHALVSEPQYQSVCEAMLIGGFSAVSREPYSLLLAWRDEAVELGVTRL
ncbi:hypothetical protein D1872_353800 [compost metagenome]